MTCPVVKPLIRVHKLVSFLNPALMAENVFHVSCDVPVFCQFVNYD